MSVVAEIYKTARGVPTDLSLKEDLQNLKALEQRIHDEVNKVGQMELIDLIAMMLPIVAAPLKEPEYFGSLFSGGPGISQASLFAKMGYMDLADVQRYMQAIFGPNPKQKFLISMKEDPSSPAGITVNKLLLLINSDDFEGEGMQNELTKALRTLGIPKGFSVSTLFKDTLEYTEESAGYDQTVLAHLLNTFVLTHFAALEPKVFDGEFTYNLSSGTGRRTYFADEGEVLFELTQPAEVPTEWFELFDKVDNEDFDLKAELVVLINNNLTKLAQAAG